MVVYVLKQLVADEDTNPINIRIIGNDFQIGRKNFDPLAKYPQVSRLHLSFHPTEAGGLLVKDERSLNGVFVNGSKIGTRFCDVNIGDIIGFGVPFLDGKEGGFVCEVTVENPPNIVKLEEEEIIDLTEEDDDHSAHNLVEKSEIVQPPINQESESNSAPKSESIRNILLNKTVKLNHSLRSDATETKTYINTANDRVMSNMNKIGCLNDSSALKNTSANSSGSSCLSSSVNGSFTNKLKTVPKQEPDATISGSIKKENCRKKVCMVSLIKCDAKHFQWPPDVKKCRLIFPKITCNNQNINLNSMDNMEEKLFSNAVYKTNESKINCVKRKADFQSDPEEKILPNKKPYLPHIAKNDPPTISMSLMNSDPVKVGKQTEIDDDICYSQVEEVIYISDDETYYNFDSSQQFIKEEPLSDEECDDENYRQIFCGDDSTYPIHTMNGRQTHNNSADDKIESIESIAAFVKATEESDSKIVLSNKGSVSTEDQSRYFMNQKDLNTHSTLLNVDQNTKDNLSNQSTKTKNDTKKYPVSIYDKEENNSALTEGGSKMIKKSTGKTLLTDPKPISYRPRKCRGREEWFSEQKKYSDNLKDAKTMPRNTNSKSSTTAERKRPSESIKIQTNNSNLKNFKIPLKSKSQDHSDKSKISSNCSMAATNSRKDSDKTSPKKPPSVKTRPEKFASRMNFLLDIEAKNLVKPKRITSSEKKPGPPSKGSDKIGNINKEAAEKQTTFKSSHNVSINSTLVQEDKLVHNTTKQECNDKIPTTNTRDPRLNKSKNIQQEQFSDVKQQPIKTNVNNIPAAPSASISTSKTTARKSSNKENYSFPFQLNSIGIVKSLIQMQPLWLHEQTRLRVPPSNVRKGAADLPLFFTSYKMYVEAFYPMIMLEIWEYMHESSKPVYESNKAINKFYFSILSCSSENDYNELRCESIVNERVSFCPREGSMVILEIRDTELPANVVSEEKSQKTSKYCKPIFGYIGKHKISALDVNSMAKWNLLPPNWLDRAEHWEFSVYIKKRPLNYDPESIMKANGICYIRSKLRMADALGHLKFSPLLSDILKPTQATFSLTYFRETPLTREYNTGQMEVINSISNEVNKSTKTPKIVLLQGPPGTGKTHTIIGLLEKLVFSNKSGLKILMAAPSNAAIDEIGSRLIELNEQSGWRDNLIKFVRVGLEKQISSKMKEHFLDRKARYLYERSINSETQKRERELRNLKAEINKLERENARTSRLKYLIDQYRVLKEKGSTRKLDFHTDLSYKINILKESHIILSTLNSCSLSVLLKTFKQNSAMQFSCCIIDESTQCTELEILQPLMFGMNKLILVGDHEQLPATVISKLACQYGFERSLFERFHLYFETFERNSPVNTLTEQFRMHSEICSFPSKHFYSQKLVTHPNTDIRYHSFPLRPYVVLDILNSQEHNNQSSKQNCPEAFVIVSICEHLLELRIPSSSIGIITPYQAQRTLYMKALSHNPRFRNIEINTVDGFQGREKDVIIFSSVRANSSSGGIGFLASKRRLNVSITRSRKCLIICAHVASVMLDPDWRALILDARERKLCHIINSPKDILSIFRHCIRK